MLVQFITEPTIGVKQRRLIRSHVMKGKNAGKTRPARKRLVHRTREQPICLLQSEAVKDELCSLDTEHTLSLQRPFWNDLSVVSYPFSVSLKTEGIVYQLMRLTAQALYPLEFCTEVNLSTYVWFQYVLEDAAYFHCLLAIASSFTDHLGGTRAISPKALKHISQAYKLTNERLSGSNACSDNVIAVVTMLAIYQRMHHQQSTGLVHFEGLRRMIQLRGGLARLAAENRALAQKPWRLSLEFSLQDGCFPIFSLSHIPNHTLLIPSSNITSSFPITTDPNLYSLAIDITHLAHLLNATNTLHQHKLNHFDYADYICIRLHRLLDYAPLSPCYRHALTPLDNILHLTLTAVMTTLLPEYGHNQAQYTLLAEQLRNALTAYAEMSLETCDAQILLWALYVGYVTVLDDIDETWIVLWVRQMYERLSLHGWEDISGVLHEFVWIGVFYDGQGMKLWKKSGREDI